MAKRVTVIGGGNGGHALSAHLSAKGIEVMIYEDENFKQNIRRLQETGKVFCTGFNEGEYDVQWTTRLEDAVSFSETLLFSVPAFAHKPLAVQLSQLVDERHKLILFAANMGSLEMHNILRDSGRQVTIGETNTLPYGCRLQADGSVHTSVKVGKFSASAYPAVNNGVILDEMLQLFDNVRESGNILEVAMNNPNPLIHPSGVLINAGKIENTGDFALYDEMSSLAIKMIRRKQEEKEKIAGMLGLSVMPFEDFRDVLLTGETKHFIECGKEGNIKGPNSLSNRYLTEDVPYGLVLLSSFGKLVEVRTPMIDAEITIAETIVGRDYMKEGRTAEYLGIDRREIILDKLNNG